MNSQTSYTILLEDLPVGSSTLIKCTDKDIAVFRTAVDEVYAIDNQCPHEGYPLLKGPVKNCVLTCPWHNFKFDLKNGDCIKGSESVGTHQTRLLDDRVEVVIASPSIEAQQAKFVESLWEGLREHRPGQVARDTVRLLKLQVEPEQLVLEAAKFDAIYAEWGTSHVLPVALDILHYFPRYPHLDAVYPMMQLMELACEQHHHHPPRKIAKPIAFKGDRRELRSKLHEAVEAEDAELAEALFRGALNSGWERAEVESFLFEVVAAYFLGYGHALIYQIKIFDLLDRIGWEHSIELLPAFLVRLIYWTREDLLPEWSWFRRSIKEVEDEFEVWFKAPRDTTNFDWDPNTFLDILLYGNRQAAFDAMTQALAGGVKFNELVDVLSQGAAQRMLNFDVAIDRANEIQNGWLAITHIATYVNALREGTRRFRQPELMRLFYYAVRFINQGKALDGPKDKFPADIVDYAAESDFVTAIQDAMLRKEHELAVAITQVYLIQFPDGKLLEEACLDLVFQDYLVRPIVIAHWIKMTVALFDEYRLSKSAGRANHVLALIRFGATPIRERWISRVSFEAIQFLDQGKVPKDLM